MASILFAGPCLIAWVLGDSMRYRRAYYANLEERAARLERDRDAQAQIATAAERARIARELHDVVAHNVSVMVVQADGAAYALGTDPGRAREALAAIGDGTAGTGRDAVLLGVLRSNDDWRRPLRLASAPTRQPRPGGAGAGARPRPARRPARSDQGRGAGQVSCTVEGEPLPLPDGTALAAYRIVQESLTNTRKHGGPWASACVLLRYGTDALELAVTDDGLGGAAASDDAGHGLTGMRERVAMYGGTVSRAAPRSAGRALPRRRLPGHRAASRSRRCRPRAGAA